MELKIPSDPRWLRMVRAMMQEVSRQAGFGEKECREITLAVDEALSNVIRHAYKGKRDGEVWLSCSADDRGLEIVVRDCGEAADPGRLDPEPPDESRLGGRGLFLMHRAMDEVRFERDGEVNLVRLRKYQRAQARSGHGQGY